MECHVVSLEQGDAFTTSINLLMFMQEYFYYFGPLARKLHVPQPPASIFSHISDHHLRWPGWPISWMEDLTSLCVNAADQVWIT